MDIANPLATKLREALSKHEWTQHDIDLIENLAVIEARESFWAFRQYLHPKMLRGWWQMEVALELQLFYEKFVHGMKPVLVLMAPPQHGKTTQIIDFISWISGNNPDLKSLYAAYSDNLGLAVNLALQRIFDNPRYNNVFPKTNIATPGSRQWVRNTELLEYVGKLGSFRRTTVEGQINGFGLDIGLVDDPIKGRKAASSKLVRDSVWNWLTDDFFNRFSERAGLLIVMTRWHVDDPVGRWLERFPNATVLRYPAIAEEDEEFRKIGEPLFPEHKSLDFLLKRKALMTMASWESLFQQHPIIVGGGLFPIEKFTIVDAMPADVVSTVRYWDKAGTQDGGAFTAGVKMSRLKDGRFIVSDVRRAQLSALNREKLLKQTSQTDNAHKPITTVVEQEPGSGGLESADATVRLLAGVKVKKDKVNDSKSNRAEPYAAQVEAGNVLLLVGEWNRAFIDEHETFPNGKYKDQVDAASGAFANLATGKYDSTLGWV